MKSNYKRLGNYIRPVDVRNTDLAITNLQGVSIAKEFVPSIANIIGTDLSTYKIVRTGQFAYGPVTSRNGDKISIALLKGDDCIISSSYSPFEIYKINELLPEYLMLWFRRPEFDRYARFMSNGSAREVFDWNCMCDVEIPVPSIDEQKKIVHAYQVITDRISLLRKINQNLESQAFAIFEKQFASMYLESDLPEGWTKQRLDTICTIKGGKRLPEDSELLLHQTNHPYIRVRDVGESRYICLTDQFQYIDDETHQEIARYIVDTDDIIISIVGTIGLIGKIHSTLNKANLTENCVRLTDIKNTTPDYLYYTLLLKRNNKEIDLLTVGAVQAKLPMYNIQSIEVVVPPEMTITNFQNRMNVFNKQIEANTLEVQSLIELSNIFLSKISR